MKIPSLILSIVLAICVSAFAQVPGGMKYQAVARDAFGEVMAQRNIKLRFSVIDSAAGSAVVFSETHSVQTGDMGLFSLLIGKGTLITGDYDNIDWSSGGKWLKIEMDPNGGNNFFTMGMSEMQAVPYAKVAATSLSDPSSTNEVITDFSFNGATNVLSVTEAGDPRTVTINEEADDLSDNTLTQLGDVDAIPLTNQVLKWNGSKWVAGQDETNEQTLSLDDNELSISDGNSVDLSEYLDNTDNQRLFLNPTQNLILITDGGQIDVSPLVNKGINVSLVFDSVTNILTLTDGTGTKTAKININHHDNDSNPMNEIQMLSMSGNLLSISNGNSVTIADNSPTNELQSLQLSGNQLSISSGNTVTLSDNSSTNELITGFSLVGNSLKITDAGGTSSVDLSGYANDADANPTNEMQNIALVGNQLSISGGNSVTLGDISSTNELQTLSMSHDTIRISNGNYIALGVNGDNSSTNELNTSAVLTGATLKITDAGGTKSVDLSALINDADANPANELNTGATLTGNTLKITDAAGTLSVDLSALEDDDADSTNELQNLTLTGTDLSISNGNTVDMSAFAQTLSYSNDTLSISNGNSVVIVDEQMLSLTGTDLSITNGNTVDMSSFMDNTDGQTLSYGGGNLSISGGNSIPMGSFVQTGTTAGGDLTGTYPNPEIASQAVTSAEIKDSTVANIDIAPNAITTSKILDLQVTTPKIAHGSITTPKIQDNNVTSSKLASNLTITGTTTFSGNINMSTNKVTNLGTPTVASDATTKAYVDAADAIATQTLTYSNDTLYISNGNSVVVEGADNQLLNLAGTDLSIDNGNTVDLTPFMDNTDGQTLGLAGNNLSITGGNSVNLGSYLDNTDGQTLSIAANNLAITGGNSVSLTPYLDNTDAQTMSIAANNLSITGGNSVDLTPYLDNTDAQTLSFGGGNLSISGGNSISMGSFVQTGTTAGGDLTGTYPNPSIATSAVTSAKILDATITSADIRDTAITTAKIYDFNVTNSKLGHASVTTAKIMDGNVTDTKIAVNAVGTTKIQDGAITSLKLASGLTLAGVTTFSGNVDMGTHTITNLAAPTAGTHATTKSYVDSVAAPQTLSLNLDTLFISNGNYVDLSSYLDNTDGQTLSLNGDTLEITGGNSVIFNDEDPTNELISNVALVNDTLKITDAGGVHTAGPFLTPSTLNIINSNQIIDREVKSQDLDTNITLIGHTMINGSYGMKITSVTSANDPYLAQDDAVILCNVTLGAMTIYLPKASLVPNRVYTIKKTDASGFVVTINPDGIETIDGILTPVLSTQYEYLQVMSNGSTWYVIGQD